MTQNQLRSVGLSSSVVCRSNNQRSISLSSHLLKGWYMQRERPWMVFLHLTLLTQDNTRLCSQIWNRKKIKRSPLLYKLSGVKRIWIVDIWLLKKMLIERFSSLLKIIKTPMFIQRSLISLMYTMMWSFHLSQCRQNNAWLNEWPTIKTKVRKLCLNFSLDTEDNYTYNMYMGLFEGLVIIALALFQIRHIMRTLETKRLLMWL
jgi:hypothetical protein